jgi:hypothetical protein
LIREDTVPATFVIVAPDFDIRVEDLSSRPPTPGAAYLATTRVIVTGERVTVFKDDTAGEAIDPTTHFKGSIHQDSYVQTVSGKKLSWRKDQACGCGSRLKSFRPFKYMSSSKDPTE